MNDAPPHYYAQSTQPDVPPPAYTFPTSFRIGSKHTTNPLISPAQLKGHLALLRAFHDLRSTIEDGKDERIPGWMKTLVPECRWTCLVAMAVERFERWCNSSQYFALHQFLEDHLPPCDVLMVWHAYLLNPSWFSEDSARVSIIEGLADLCDIFTSTMPRLGEIVNEKPSLPRVNSWTSITSTSFNLLDAVPQLTHKRLVCPACRNFVHVEIFNVDGTGYCQQKFTMKCPACKFAITKQSMAVLKLAKDLACEGITPKSYLAGTLHTPTNPLDTARGKTVKDAILSAPKLLRPLSRTPGGRVSSQAWERNIQTQTQHSLQRLRGHVGEKMKASGGRLLPRIMSAYTDDSPFSVDLLGAVLRQASFVKKMHDLGWTEPGFFDGEQEEVVLQHAVARYHAFLDLMASSPASFFVPTLDIDLAWHTHQLMAVKYKSDCLQYVRRFIDHDDRVEENYLSSAFDITCRAWQTRFGVPYMHCGCPLPGETIGQKLSRLVMSQNELPSYLVPPNQPNLLAGTHPSDHNAMFTFHHKKVGESAREKREAKIKSRRKRDTVKATKGKTAGRNVQRGDMSDHHPAFLMPVPLYYYGGIGACAAYYGGVGDGGGVGSCGGSSACAAGAGGCTIGGSACGSGGGCGSAGCGGGGGGCGGGGCGGGGCGGG